MTEAGLVGDTADLGCPCEVVKNGLVVLEVGRVTVLPDAALVTSTKKGLLSLTLTGGWLLSVRNGFLEDLGMAPARTGE